jgi:hypothetical protein
MGKGIARFRDAAQMVILHNRENKKMAHSLVRFGQKPLVVKHNSWTVAATTTVNVVAAASLLAYQFAMANSQTLGPTPTVNPNLRKVQTPALVGLVAFIGGLLAIAIAVRIAYVAYQRCNHGQWLLTHQEGAHSEPSTPPNEVESNYGSIQNIDQFVVPQDQDQEQH